MSLLGTIKRTIFRISRPYKDLRREIWKDVTTDIAHLIENPEVIFDVGANVGQTARIFRSEFPNSTIYCFEPYDVAFEQLKDFANSQVKIKPYNIALSDRDGNDQLYISDTSVLNSMLPPTSIRTKQFTGDSVNIRTETLDTFCSHQGINKIGLLKLDVQGGEMKVLNGAKAILRKACVKAILVEINFVSFYDNQALWWEVPSFLYQYGYNIFDFYQSVYGKNGHIRWCDALFYLPT